MCIDGDADKRRRLTRYYRNLDRLRDRLEAQGVPSWDLARYFPPFPDDLRGVACGAKTRAGTPCKMTSLFGNGRCKLHGGLSTGPVTAEGKAQSAINGLKPKRRKLTP